MKKNGVYLEVYTIVHDFSDGFASINYERLFGKEKIRAIRIGIYPDFATATSIPVTLTRITRPWNKHHLEYGFGFVYRGELYEGHYYQDFPAMMLPLMYRYQKSDGLFIRAGINLWLAWSILPSPSFSLGYRF